MPAALLPGVSILFLHCLSKQMIESLLVQSLQICPAAAIPAQLQCVQDATKGQSEGTGYRCTGTASCPSAGSYCNTIPVPVKRDPKTSGRGCFAPPVSAMWAGNRFRSPIKCLPSELHCWLPACWPQGQAALGPVLHI